MAQFRMEVAGQVGEVISLYDSTRDYCRKYLTDREPAFLAEVSREDLEFEQADLRREAEEEGMRVRTFTDPFLERAAIQRKFAEFLFDKQVLMVHGSVVAVDGEGYLFTAKCGTGKSTHTRLWRQVFGDRAVMVNDDKPFLRIGESGVYAYGSPWSGKHGLASNVCFPLKGICILRRGAVNVIRSAWSENVRGMLLHQTLVPDGDTKVPELVGELVRRVPLWEMECTKDPEAARIAYRAMRASGEARR